MGKLTTYMLVLSGLMLLFYFTGLTQDCSDGLCNGATPNSALLNAVMHPENIQEMPTWTKILLALEGVGAILGGIAIGYFSGGNLQAIVTAPVAIFFFSLLADFLYVFNRVREVNSFFAIVLFGPVIFLYVITIIEWWTGRD